jgi:RNA polymerase sigma-70 factor (ECF subfamily)
VTALVADLLTIADSAPRPAAESRETPQVQALLAAAQTGDREAFGDLVTLHERIVFRTALAALGRAEDAQDAAQDAFVVAWQKLGGFRGESSFRTWLLTIVWRKALDRRRRRSLWWNRTLTPAATVDVDPLDSVTTSSPDPERTAIARDVAARVREEIAGLTPKLKDTLLLAASGEHSYEEIATIVGAPIGTVKWRVAEARRLVTKRIQK